MIKTLVGKIRLFFWLAFGMLLFPLFYVLSKRMRDDFDEFSRDREAWQNAQWDRIIKEEFA